MLLLTDDVAEGGEVKRLFDRAQPCAMLALDEALKEPAAHTMIACYAALDDATLPKLRAALEHHRRDPRTPVLVLTDDSSAYTSMQATALGSTRTLPRRLPDDTLLAALQRLLRQAADGPGGRPGDLEPGGLEAGIKQVGTALWSMLEVARRGETISPAALERSADLLLVSIRRSEIRQWLNVVRRYDDITFQHCLLVAGLVAGFSCRLGLAAPRQRVLAQAALVHDVGKAGIPQHVLNKAGPLTPAETALMRTHPAAGHAMLARQNGLGAGVLAIVRHHHEYLDGSGYPDGLRGAQISDLVRLVTICDIFAALIERRSYKPPMPARQAYAILLEMDGKLDTSLLKAFEGFAGEM